MKDNYKISKFVLLNKKIMQESNLNLMEYSWSLFAWQMLVLAFFILWIHCLVDISKASFEGNDKLIWSLIVLFVPFIGSLLYLFIGKKRKLKES